jgi:hypothetical protein
MLAHAFERMKIFYYKGSRQRSMNNEKYQYSLLDARPEKSAYLIK